MSKGHTLSSLPHLGMPRLVASVNKFLSQSWQSWYLYKESTKDLMIQVYSKDLLDSVQKKQFCCRAFGRFGKIIPWKFNSLPLKSLFSSKKIVLQASLFQGRAANLRGCNRMFRKEITLLSLLQRAVHSFLGDDQGEWFHSLERYSGLWGAWT